jgi:hypothetical protein
MTTPQSIAYFLQIDYWMRKYKGADCLNGVFHTRGNRLKPASYREKLRFTRFYRAPKLSPIATKKTALRQIRYGLSFCTVLLTVTNQLGIIFPGRPLSRQLRLFGFQHAVNLIRLRRCSIQQHAKPVYSRRRKPLFDCADKSELLSTP